MNGVRDIIRQQLAPAGVLKAALNLSNSLLNKGRDASGQWLGVAPDLARAIADRLEVPVEFVPYAKPAEVAAAVHDGEWTIALIAADPARSGAMAFTAPYSQIEAAYMVSPGSAITRLADVDRPGIHVAAYKGSAYGLWLERNLSHAALVNGATFEEAFDRFRSGEADVLASLVPRLELDRTAWPGCRILEGLFMTVQQAVACRVQDAQAILFLREFVDAAVRRGWIADLIRAHGVQGLRAAAADGLGVSIDNVN